MAIGFVAYFCMYAFRKPFGAGTYEGDLVFGLEPKTLFVIAQLVGYTLSKYVGVRLLSELSAALRLRALLATVVFAELALIAFGAISGPWAAVALFFNGLPLGLVWGLVVRSLEGRRSSELLLAGLSASFIVASGAVKDVGRMLMRFEVSEDWMPAATGALFLPLFVLAAVALDRLPPPTPEDAAERSERRPMAKPERRALLRRFPLGFFLLFFAYFFLTAYRDFRDNYGVEIFAELGYQDEPVLFTQTELPVAFVVVVVLGLLNLARSRRGGLAATYAVMIAGLLLLGVSTWLRTSGAIDGAMWMICTGLGSYLAYVPYGSVLFDRLLAKTGVAGTAVFAIYVADALGYTGSVALQLYRDLAHADVSRLAFFDGFTISMGCVGAALLLASWYDFARERPLRLPKPE